MTKRVFNALDLEKLVRSRQKANISLEDERKALPVVLVRRKEIELLEVTVVLTRRTDPTDDSQATGEIVDGAVRPTAPHWRNPTKHTEAGQNYIRDWIDLANHQLLSSGANFGLDSSNINYVLAFDDALNARGCRDGKHLETLGFIDAQLAKDSSEDNLWRDRVLVVVRWGPNADFPQYQSCAGANSPFLLMGAYDEAGREWDGVHHFGNNLFTHELGHFLGCYHTFPKFAADIQGIARSGGALSEALALIRDHPFPNLDADNHAFGLPPEYRVDDTVVDLGWGVNELHGDPVCGGTQTYTFERFDEFEKVTQPDGTEAWQPTADAAITTFDYTVDSSVRGNILSYWSCHPESKRFSARQVARMRNVAREVRSNLRRRVVYQNIFGLPSFREKKRVWPWEELIDPILQYIRAIAIRIPFVRAAAARRYDRMIPAYRPWRPERLSTWLQAAGLPETVEELIACGVEEHEEVAVPFSSRA